MSSKLLAGTVAAAGIGLAACGGGGASAHRASVPGSGSRPTQVFRVQMNGTSEMPPGAKHGVGAAVIAFHGASTVCWRFAHLHGFTGATSARVDVGGAGRTGQAVIVLSRGPNLRHQGCVRVSATLSRSIVAHPAGYYVSIASKRYPQGALRAQL